MNTRPSWHAALVLALWAVVLPATAVAAPGPDSGAIVADLPLPGGVAGLLRASGVPATADPATAMLAFIRVAHVLNSKPPGHTLAYLDAVTRLQAASAALPGRAVSLSGPASLSAQRQAWASACGLVVARGAVTDAEGAEAAGRRTALTSAGLPIAEWVSRLNAGETVPVGIPVENVPLPLTPDVWLSAVLERRVPLDRLARAVFGERRAALVYYGLMGLDDGTLAYLAGHTTLLSAIARRSAGVLAEWGRAIHVRNGRVQLPGGDGTAALWQEVVGHAPAETDGFILALLGRDGGRAAFFYDTVDHLDPARRDFALGAAGSDRVQRIRALYGVFARTRTIDSTLEWPVVRHPFNPAAVLHQVVVDRSGAMAGPAWRGLWDAALGGNSAACASASDDGRTVDAAWLVDRIEREPLEVRDAAVGSVAFAQRVFSRATPADLGAVCAAVVAFPHEDGLLLTLERIGLDSPADYSLVLGFAERSWAGADRRAAVVRTAQVQGILAVLERAVSARTVTSARARALITGLTSLSGGGAVGRWMRGVLLPALCQDAASADGCLVREVAGEGAPGSSGRVVSWEDERYRVDLGAATTVRLERVRQAQRATRLDDALNVLAVADILADPKAGASDLERAAAILAAVTPGLDLGMPELFGHPVAPMRPAVEAAAARLAPGHGAAGRGAAAAGLLDVSDVLLADALVSFAYAMAIGDPDDASLLGGNPARRHSFDGTVGGATEAWHAPDEVQMLDRTWVIEGSVLMMRSVYGRTWQRRLSIQDPGAGPRPDPQDVRAFGDTAAAFNAFALTDAGRDAIVGAIERGRARIANLLASPDQLWQVAAEVGLGEWRCRAAIWASQRPPGAPTAGALNPVGLFSLAELMRLGRPEISQADLDAWGVATRPVNGSPWVAMPRGHTWEDFQGPRGAGVLPTQMAEVHLRVAEALSELKLPAVLAPDVAAYAGWDVMTSAEMAFPDDWFALSRAARLLPKDRFLDYVSALTAIGPLVPEK